MSQPSISTPHGFEAMPSAISTSTAQLTGLENIDTFLDEEPPIKIEEGEIQPFILDYDWKTEAELNAAASRGAVLCTRKDGKQHFELRSEMAAIIPAQSSQMTQRTTPQLPLRKRKTAIQPAQNPTPVITGGRGSVRVASMNSARRSIEEAPGPAPKRQRVHKDPLPPIPSPAPECSPLPLPHTQDGSVKSPHDQHAASALAAAHEDIAALRARLAQHEPAVQLETPPNSQSVEPEDPTARSTRGSEMDLVFPDPSEKQVEIPPHLRPIEPVEEPRDRRPLFLAAGHDPTDAEILDGETSLQPEDQNDVAYQNTYPTADDYTDDEPMYPYQQDSPYNSSRRGSSGMSEIGFQEPPPTAKSRPKMRRHRREMRKAIAALRHIDSSTSGDESDEEEESSYFRQMSVLPDRTRSPTVHPMPELEEPDAQTAEELSAAQRPRTRSSTEEALGGRPYAVVIPAFPNYGWTAANRPQRQAEHPPAQTSPKKPKKAATPKQASPEQARDELLPGGRRQNQKHSPLPEAGPAPRGVQKQLFGRVQQREMSRFPSIPPKEVQLFEAQPQPGTVSSPQPEGNLAQTISTAEGQVAEPSTAEPATVRPSALPIKRGRGRPRKNPLVVPEPIAIAEPAPAQEPIPDTTVPEPPVERQPSQAPSSASDSSDDLPTMEDLIRSKSSQKPAEAAPPAERSTELQVEGAPEIVTSTAQRSSKGKDSDYVDHPHRGTAPNELAEPFVHEVDERAAQEVNVDESTSTASVSTLNGAAPSQKDNRKKKKHQRLRKKKTKQAEETSDASRPWAQAPAPVSLPPASLLAQQAAPMSQPLVDQSRSTEAVSVAALTATVSASNPGVKMKAVKTAKPKLPLATQNAFNRAKLAMAEKKRKEKEPLNEDLAAEAQLQKEGRVQHDWVLEVEMETLAKLRQEEKDSKIAAAAAAAAIRDQRRREVTAGPECNIPPPTVHSTIAAPQRALPPAMTPRRFYGKDKGPNTKPREFVHHHMPEDTPEAESPAKEEARTIILSSEEPEEQAQKIHAAQTEQPKSTSPPAIPAALAAPNTPPTQVSQPIDDTVIDLELMKLGFSSRPQLVSLVMKAQGVLETTREHAKQNTQAFAPTDGFPSFADTAKVFQYMIRLGRNDRPRLKNFLRIGEAVLKETEDLA